MMTRDSSPNDRAGSDAVRAHDELSARLDAEAARAGLAVVVGDAREARPDTTRDTTVLPVPDPIALCVQKPGRVGPALVMLLDRSQLSVESRAVAAEAMNLIAEIEGTRRADMPHLRAV